MLTNRIDEWEARGRPRGFSRIFDAITDLDVWQESDEEGLRGLVETVCAEFPKAVADGAVDFLVGRLMKTSGGKASPIMGRRLIASRVVPMLRDDTEKEN